MNIINIFFAINGILIAIFLCYHCFFIICYFIFRLYGNKDKLQTLEKLNKFAIIVPAHNEEKIISHLIKSVKNLNYPKDKYELIIIADNCTDATEKIIKDEGVQCFVRKDNVKKGKPFALGWIFQQIEIDCFDGFTIVDADTIVDRNYLNELNQKLNEGSEAIQGYFGIMNPDETWFTKLSVIPGILKFKFRYFCKDKMNLSCPLMGNGMCFSRKIIKEYGWNAFSITENWEYYIKLLLNGHIVKYSENAIIYSHAVIKLSHGETQRKRWFKGRLGVCIDYCKIIFAKVARNGDIRLIDGLIELILPSYSMLFNWTALIFLLSCFIALLGANLSFYIKLFLFFVGIQCTYFAISLIVSKASLKTWLMLIYVPFFLIWKLIVTLKGLIGFKDKEWQKTERRM